MEEIRRIRAALAAGVTKKELADRSGVARRVLDSIDDPNWNPTLQTITALSSAAAELAAEKLRALKGVA